MKVLVYANFQRNRKQYAENHHPFIIYFRVPRVPVLPCLLMSHVDWMGLAMFARQLSGLVQAAWELKEAQVPKDCEAKHQSSLIFAFLGLLYTSDPACRRPCSCCAWFRSHSCQLPFLPLLLLLSFIGPCALIMRLKKCVYPRVISIYKIRSTRQQSAALFGLKCAFQRSGSNVLG